MPRRPPGQHGLTVLIAVLVAVAAMLAVLALSAGAAGFVPISGSGSTWSSNALDQWRRNVANLFDHHLLAALSSVPPSHDFVHPVEVSRMAAPGEYW